MINVVDLLWIEQRGMSIITAIFFMGVFVAFGSMFWWMRKEISDIDVELAHQKFRLNDTQKDVSDISVELGKILVKVENTETMTGRLIEHILK